MVDQGVSSLLSSLKGKKIDITTAAGAHIVGNLQDIDNDYLLMFANNQQLLVPKTAVALIAITGKRPGEGEMSVQEAA